MENYTQIIPVIPSYPEHSLYLFLLFLEVFIEHSEITVALSPFNICCAPPPHSEWAFYQGEELLCPSICLPGW